MMDPNADFVLPSILEGEDKSSPLGNRIRKTYRHLRKWAKRTHTNCFRIYDRELAHYPLAIDFYAGRYCVHYFALTTDDEPPPDALKQEAIWVLCTILGARPEQIYWRTRARSKETRQYEKAAELGDFFTVLEYGVKFKVNLLDYLDTGLFLDHRETRQVVASSAKDKRLLNLFAYTCAFSVHAAIAGAAFTKSVDLSNTYTDWGRDNFLLNALPLKNNPIVRADCLKFLNEEILSGQKYDIIVIDPPTISKSKKMAQMFDVQIDHASLISKALKLLQENGTIYFSTNARRFVFEEEKFKNCLIKEISYKTVPLDFHDPKIHRCWKISLHP